MTYVTSRELTEAKRIFKAVPVKPQDCEIPNDTQEKIAGCKAAEVVRKAHSESETIVKSANDQAAQIMEKARREGFSQGQAEAKKRYDELLAAIQKSMHQMEEICKEMQVDLRETIIAISMEMAAKTIRQQITIAPESVASLAEDVLSKIAPAREAVVRLNPKDFEALKELEPRFESAAGYPDKFKVSPDNSLGRGDVLVQYERGTVDAKITTQLENIARTILASFD